MSNWHLSRRKARRRRQFFFIICIAIGIVLIAIAFPITLSYFDSRKPSPYVAVAPPAPDWSSYFASTTIAGRAGYVVDLTTGQTLFSKDASEPLPLASLTKLMTTVTALDSTGTSTVVAVTRLALTNDGDNGLYGNERWTLGDLLKFTLVVSSNDGAAAVAENIGALLSTPGEATSSDAAPLVWSASAAALNADQQAFVQKMNDVAPTIGLSESSFANPTGLDMSTTTAGAYGSAEDVARLLMYVSTHYPEIINATRYSTITIRSLSNLTHHGSNTDSLSLQGFDLLASKTGYTDLAGGNLAILDDIAGHPVVIVVLGSTYEDRFSDVAALASTSAQVIAAGG